MLKDLPKELFDQLPIEVWLIVRKYLVRFTLKDLLVFPVSVQRPRFFQYYSVYWQSYCGDHRWDVESNGPLHTSLIGQNFRNRRVQFDLAGILFAL